MTESRDLTEIGVLGGIGLDGHLRIDHLSFGERPLTSYDSALGAYTPASLQGSAVVTLGGEAWAAFRYVDNGAVGYTLIPITLPPGRTAIVATSPGFYGGVWVWLDDGTVGSATSSLVDGWSIYKQSTWTRLDVPDVAMPPQLPAR